MSFIEFHNVSKEYTMGEQTIRAVDGVSFHIERGEFCVIVGASGAGKTTILNMLGGIDNCTSGQIFLDGAEVSRFDAKKLTQYRLSQLEEKVNKHNNLIERTFKLEGRMDEAEHDIKDLKKFHIHS